MCIRDRRNLLDEETLRHNQACIKNQLAKFLDFESDVPNLSLKHIYVPPLR